MATVYTFGPFQLDPATRRLTRDGSPVPLAERHFDVLVQLVARAGDVVSKDALIATAWQDVAVTDNSLEQAISVLRRSLGNRVADDPYIKTVPRQGYRFTGVVTRSAARATDASLDALLAPHRAWIEGRAAIETLERDQILRARGVFEQVLASSPDQASAHVGVANACVLQFEMTRADAEPDKDALSVAVHHAREACRLDPDYGEAWATLGFVLDRAGHHADAQAASKRAVTLEPDNWRHHLRLAYLSWGEERLRAAHRTLALLPGLPLARWLAATVHVARNALDEAARELTAGLAAQEAQAEHSRFSAVALDWLYGLVLLARGDEDEAAAAFERELSRESSGHLYARECCANTWYAIGATRLRQRRVADARIAFGHALERVAMHPMARVASVGAAQADGEKSSILAGNLDEHFPWGSVDAALCRAAYLTITGNHNDAAASVNDALAGAAPGSAGWLLPVEPLLHVTARPDIWAHALARLRTRAA